LRNAAVRDGFSSQEDDPMPDEKDTDKDPNDGYETDTFSRGDAEGATAKGGERGAAGDVEREVANSPDDKYETDAFSRNDAEGGTAVGEDAP
jgi:hypothetical protein